MNCPNCRSRLKTINYEGVAIETCPSCGGEWLDHKELGHVVRAREIRFNAEERRAIAESTTITGVPLAGVDRDLPCPKCGGTTDAINYGADSGIILDRCAVCRGMWLDGGELEKVQMLVEGWEDNLPEDLAKYGPRLRKIEARLDREDDVRVSGFGFINALINGVLDIVM